GNVGASAAGLARAVKERARALRRAPGDDLIDRIVEVAVYWAEPEVVGPVEGLGPHLREWVVGFLIAAVVKMARYRKYELEVRRLAGDPDALLALLEEETSFMMDDLPQAIRRAVEAAGDAGTPARSQARRAVEERCLAIAACRGPFFPQGMALETLGELRSVGAVNEIIDFLSEENSYLYEAAEHALSKLDGAVIEPARARLEAGNLEEDSGHSLLIILCEQGTAEAAKLILEHADFFVEAAGPGNAARWMSLLGTRDLIEPLRRHLPKDTAQVGQAILLLAAIHNVRVPEDAGARGGAGVAPDPEGCGSDGRPLAPEGALELDLHARGPLRHRGPERHVRDARCLQGRLRLLGCQDEGPEARRGVRDRHGDAGG